MNSKWSGFQYQDGFARAGDLVLIADLGQFEEGVVESIHVEVVAADQHLDADDGTEEGDILDLAIKDIGFPFLRRQN